MSVQERLMYILAVDIREHAHAVALVMGTCPLLQITATAPSTRDPSKNNIVVPGKASSRARQL